jgi:diamine N-acetyltransferase
MTDLPTPSPTASVSLRLITKDTVRDILRLKVGEAQEQFVADNGMSLAQAHFTREAWYRGIYAGDTPVGFMMLYDDPVKPEYFLWRLMIDQRYQRMGFARQAMALLVDYVKTRPDATELLVSHVEGEGNPGPFYAGLGFEYTGEKLSGELVMRLPLQAAAEAPAPAAPPKPLTHVVLFKLKDRSSESMARTTEVMRAMEGKISTLQAIEVGANVVASPRAYDLALITRFASLADMQAYQAHPIHQGVLAHMNAVMESAVAVDFEQE